MIMIGFAGAKRGGAVLQDRKVQRDRLLAMRRAAARVITLRNGAELLVRIRGGKGGVSTAAKNRR